MGSRRAAVGLTAIMLAGCTDPPSDSVGPPSRDVYVATDRESDLHDTGSSGLDAASDADIRDHAREREGEWKFD